MPFMPTPFLNMTRIIPNLLLIVATHLQLSQAAPAALSSAPTVQLDSATITGNATGTSNTYYGIPFVLPPTGERRLREPQPIGSYSTDIVASDFGPACPQLNLAYPTPYLPSGVSYLTLPKSTSTLPQSEDCLTVNVVTPANVKPGSKLPVAVWIYGGGFQTGTASSYDGTTIVDRSIKMGQPVIYVSMNYRLAAFGFLASKEVQDAGLGNLGLLDQREAFRWVQKYISNFGGDPTKVTIWGESAGAVSTGFHLIANNGNNEGLFRAGFMQSGSPEAVGDLTGGQKEFDFIVDQTNCTSATDKLECLRGLSYDTFKAAMDKTAGIFDYRSLNMAWQPRIDGIYITETPQKLVQEGKVVKVPFVTGDCDDEGTMFALSTLNITTDAQFKTYLKQWYYPNAPDAVLNGLLAHYPSDPHFGAPHDTGTLNAITPQYKRIAAFMGDALFQAPRRFLLQHQSPKLNTWSFLSKRFKSNPILGSVHASDLLNSYGGEMGDYLINFVNNLDPNGKDGDGKTLLNWPKYSNKVPSMMTFLDGPLPMTITHDDYRKAAIEYLIYVELNNLLH